MIEILFSLDDVDVANEHGIKNLVSETENFKIKPLSVCDTDTSGRSARFTQETSIWHTAANNGGRQALFVNNVSRLTNITHLFTGNNRYTYWFLDTVEMPIKFYFIFMYTKLVQANKRFPLYLYLYECKVTKKILRVKKIRKTITYFFNNNSKFCKLLFSILFNNNTNIVLLSIYCIYLYVKKSSYY